VASTGADVRLVPLSLASDPGLLVAVLGLDVLPEQGGFVIPASQTFAAAAADPDRTPFAVLAADSAVGFGVLDRRGHLAELLDEPGRGVLLRAFYVGAGHQGRGHGTAAARAVRSLAAVVAPSADLVVLTVHERNAPARAAYARAGYADTGARYTQVAGDPQLVMVAGVRRPQPRAATLSR
jgi:RimJ/RimL family protein N-acetyltransferase